MHGGGADVEGIGDLRVGPRRTVRVGLEQHTSPQRLGLRDTPRLDQILKILPFSVSETDDVLGFLAHDTLLVLCEQTGARYRRNVETCQINRGGPLVHRTTFGRSFRAIGFAPEGARYAGIPVERRLRLAYVLAGFVAGLAAVIYVARVGQAKADAGTGYELLAITAVVLGGASIFGGTGSVHGTLLGVGVLAVLKIGLTLSDQPSELAGILTGGLLLAVLAGESVIKQISARRAIASAATVKLAK